MNRVTRLKKKKYACHTYNKQLEVILKKTISQCGKERQVECLNLLANRHDLDCEN